MQSSRKLAITIEKIIFASRWLQSPIYLLLMLVLLAFTYEIAKEIASILGGSGGGDAKFAQGGGKDTSKKDQAIAKLKSMILEG